MAQRYLAPEYAPEAVADRCGIPAPRIRALAEDSNVPLVSNPPLARALASVPTRLLRNCRCAGLPRCATMRCRP
jgi:type III secretion system FlhB-like substrate exporter